MIYFGSTNKEDFNYPAQIAKKLDISPTYIYSLINTLENKGVINIIKVGRAKKIELTPYGISVCAAAKEIYMVLKNDA